MDPIMRLMLAAVGGILGARVAGPGNQALGLVLGACTGFAIGELLNLRARVAALDADIKRLRIDPERERTPSPAPGASPQPSPDSPAAAAPSVASPVASPAAPSVASPTAPPAASPAAPSVASPTAPPAASPTGSPVAPPTASSTKPPGTVPAAVPQAPPERPWRELETPPPPLAPTPTPAGALPESPVIAAVRAFITGGNALVRAGVIVLFFGVAFLLRYMAEHTRVSIEFRLTGVALAGVALLLFGWRLRRSRSGYALALQGGGVGILYLTVFAALHLYAVLSAAAAFPILALIALLSAMLAVLQNSMSFALLGVIGGFLAPVLASTGEGNHIVLFSYYAVLNAGILAIAWFKSWRPLNLAGFVFTFAVGTAWGVLQYRAQDFASTEPFLVWFFLLFLGISILFTWRQPARLTGYIDGTLIFGTAIVVFALQSSMLHGRLMALAYSAIAMSAVYLACAWLLKRRGDPAQALLIEAFIALGVAFLTLAVPLALNARLNAATWALEGAALIWVGCRQRRALPRVAGALLNLASGCILATQFDATPLHTFLPLGSYFGVLTQTAAAVFAARTLHLYRQRLTDSEQLVPDLLFCWGLMWWVIGGLAEISQYLPAYAAAGSLAFVTGTAWLSSEFHRRVPLAAAAAAALLQLPAMLIVLTACSVVSATHPFAAGGWLSWPLAFAGWYLIAHRHEGPARAALANLVHAVAAWLLAVIVGWEAARAIRLGIGGSTAWAATAWAAFPALSLFLLPRLVTRIHWPFARNRDTYLFMAGTGMAVYLALWSVVTNLISQGESAPLPYIPLLNPLDLGQAFVLLILFRYWRFLGAVRAAGFMRLDARVPLPALCALTFIWFNALLLRTLHQWFGVPFGFDELLGSTLVQTALSIFWAILALATMLFAARRHLRATWLVGASLLGVVVAKLFLVDLSRIGSIERIVSFVGVGVLMLVVGYFSPLPPAAKARP
ncbi:MAG: DUF2339 domain-containing protein [Steroidobacteraceae bacterium]